MATSQTEPFVPGALIDSPYQQDRSRLLPDLNQFLLSHSDLRTAFPGVCRRIYRSLPHQFAGIALHEPGLEQLRLFVRHVLPGGIALPADFTFPLDGTPAGEAYRLQRPILVDDLRSPQFTCETTRELLKHGNRSGFWVPLKTANSLLGALWISSCKPGAYRPEEAAFLNEVAGQISPVLANQIALEQLGDLRRRLETQSNESPFPVSESPQTGAVGIVRCSLSCQVLEANSVFLNLLGISREHIQKGLNLREITPPEYLALCEHSVQELRQNGYCHPIEKEYQRPDGTRVPVLVSAGTLRSDPATWVGFIVDLRGRRTISTAPIPSPAIRPETRSENSLIRTDRHDIEALTAKSPTMQKVIRELEKVGPNDTTVLLLGETGTGKDVLAHALCQMSPRRHHPFIKVNCAAIPAGLLESELFGYEKGAFTGAQARKIGRLELAHQGTLFLDEVGDIPLELQPKLLRVLQEREFERLGSTQTIKVNIRLIAATNRDLAQMSASNQFRRDLFYRLSVFPVRVPPLRDRPESISVLTNLFVEKFAKQMSRPHLTVPPATMAALEAWSWPGNIRELENLIERAVILSPGPDLRVNLDELRAPAASAPLVGQTLNDVEREHIRHVLHDTNGVVGGKHGAASRLGLKRTTLQYKMKKLEISRY